MDGNIDEPLAARPAGGLGPHRLVAGFVLTTAALPGLTAALVAVRGHLSLLDCLLLYLVTVVAVAIVGGLWPAVAAAVAASLLLNWFFTPPLHTWNVDSPQNILALLLFVAIAVIVSAVVHLAARRAATAAARDAEASTLLALTTTVFSSDDSPDAILARLDDAVGVRGQLLERAGPEWVPVAGSAGTGPATQTIGIRDDLRLCVYDHADHRPGRRILDAFGAQAAAALDRRRLRAQAAQAEALAEGNRMRTALLAAVSHDLRTPLSSVKAAVSTLRQGDVAWTKQEQAELLETIEEGTDRLDALIGNLLDMSRIQAGALRPFIRPTAIDEVAPLALRGLDGSSRLRFDLPDDLPLVATDPGLLERVLGNVVANALRHSPPDQPPTLTATAAGGRVRLYVVDHGPGVRPADRQRMFEPFQQLGDRRPGAGVGLGLAVASGFVEALGGSIAATDTPGGGLTMLVDLPAAAPAGVPAPVPGEPP